MSLNSSGNIKKGKLLDGIRVLDLSRILAGPFCSQMLGDMGAEIIKVEQPNITKREGKPKTGGGDGTRLWGPPFVQGESSYFMSVNRNKKSITVNLTKPEGRDLILKLAKNCDVLIENFLPGKMEEFGLGYEDIKKVNPRLVYCSISGFGSTGPYADSQKPGFDIIVSAMYGMMQITGPEGSDQPIKPGVAITDVCTGLTAHGAILAALLERERTSGLGQKVETSLMESQLAALVNIASSYLTAGVDQTKKWGTAHPSIVPYQSFSCSDRLSIVVGVGSDPQFVEFCSAIGRSDLSANELFRTNALRVANRVALVGIITDIMKTQPRPYWEAKFKDYSFPFGPVRGIKESFEDEQAIARNMSVEVTHPKCGPIKVVGPPVKYSRTPCEVALPPPLLGEHTDAVLADILGLTAQQCKDLRDGEVI
jgi:succinate--hydroxymethylglutarate CoA-transferase